MAGKIGIDPGFLVNIFQGKNHLSPRYLDAVEQFCELDEREAKYFRKLFQYNKARSPREVADRWEELQSLRQVESKMLGHLQAQFYAKWEHSLVRALIGLHGFNGDCASLAALAYPPISVSQVQESVDILQQLEFLQKDPQGFWRLKVDHVTAHAGVSPQTVRGLHRQFLGLALDAVEGVVPDQRDISGLTLTIPSKELPLLRNRIAEFRAELVRMVDESQGHDRVFQFNVQLFPLSRGPEAAL
jgi:uncharacterized protein (TIGR02147 family)